MPITNAGYTAESESKIQERIQKLFQKNLGKEVVLDKKGSPMTSIFLAESGESLINDTMLGNAYAQLNIETATGKNLDHLANLNGIYRSANSHATVLMTFSGNVGLVIPAGFLIATSSEVIFKTLAFDRIAQGGTVNIECQCLTEGVGGNVDSGAINVIVNPLSGLNSVVNESPAVGGGFTESDEELREKIKNLTSSEIGTASLLVKRLYDVDGVILVNYRENSEFSKTNDLPPLSINFVIDGGKDEDIAKVFLDYSAIPFHTVGKTSVSINNLFGRSITYRFDRTSVLKLHIKAVFKLLKKIELTTSFKTTFESEIFHYINSLKTGLTLSGSQVLAGVSNNFLNSFQEELDHIENIEILLRKDNQTEYKDYVVFEFNEKGSKGTFIYG